VFQFAESQVFLGEPNPLACLWCVMGEWAKAGGGRFPRASRRCIAASTPG
jgi:hypothetical protein